MGVDPSSSSSRRAPLRCSRLVRLSLAFCLRMCRIPRPPPDADDGPRWALADADSRRSDDPWKDDHASTLAGQERDAVVAARARAAAVDTDDLIIRPILKKNEVRSQKARINCQNAQTKSLPAPGQAGQRNRKGAVVPWYCVMSNRKIAIST